MNLHRHQTYGVEQRPIPGWEDRYSAGSDGLIYSHKTGRSLFHGVNSRTGRYQVKLWRQRQVKTTNTHVLVCVTFHGQRPPGTQASHLNGNCLDNRPSNLTWESVVDNMARKADHGTLDAGLANSRACVDRDGILDIRRRAFAGEPYDKIASDYGISKASVSRIKTGRRYADVV